MIDACATRGAGSLVCLYYFETNLRLKRILSKSLAKIVYPVFIIHKIGFMEIVSYFTVIFHRFYNY